MKIKVYVHKGVKATINDDFTKVVNYFKSDFVKKFIPDGIDIIFDIEKTKIAKQDVLVKLMKPLEGQYDVVMYLYNRGDFSDVSFGLCFSVAQYLRGIYLATSVIDDAVDYTWKSMAHEILHAIVYKVIAEKGVAIENKLDTYYKNEDLYAIDGNFAHQLEVLKPYLKTIFKYFSPKEVVGLSKELVSKLDIMRGECGFPFIINSGFRTKEQNEVLRDSVEDSAHLFGLGVDLKCDTSAKRFKMIESAIRNGITRIGIGKNYIHLDIDKTKPQNLIWVY